MSHFLIFATAAQITRWATSLLSSLHGACIPIALVLSFTVSATARAELIINDAVFAHNFDSIAGDTITALTGPNAQKTSNLSASSDDPVGFGASQHVRAPDSDYAAINTNTRLSSSTSQLSFSIFYNARNDNGNDDDGYEQVRLLSSYNGTGLPPSETVFGLISDGGRRLAFSTEGQSYLSSLTTPANDNTWHQTGFVFEGGQLTFYFDGAPIGDTISVAHSVIPEQTYDWHLIEDANPISNITEYFDLGDYDEAALWKRALSSSEMNALYTQGLASAVPEPATIVMWCMAGLAGVGIVRCQRRKLECER
jgi:hypothetical protein